MLAEIRKWSLYAILSRHFIFSKKNQVHHFFPLNGIVRVVTNSLEQYRRSYDNKGYYVLKGVMTTRCYYL